MSDIQKVKVHHKMDDKTKIDILKYDKHRLSRLVHDNNIHIAQKDNIIDGLTHDRNDLIKTLDEFTHKHNIMLAVFERLKSAISQDQSKFYDLLEMIFEKDYSEDTYNVPVWLGALTQYYSHKDTVIYLLKALEVKNVPDNVNQFRLPIDWTEGELDIFMDTMSNHVNCNNNVFQHNLNYWSPNALLSVEDMCNQHYDEIPWQYVLRNPRLKSPKYLTLIGQNLVMSLANWYKFSYIDKYQELTDEELSIILNNITNIDKLKYCCSSDEFIIRHLSLVTNESLLDRMYELMKTRHYDMIYNKLLLEFPAKYIMKYVTECIHESRDALEILKLLKSKDAPSDLDLNKIKSIIVEKL